MGFRIGVKINRQPKQRFYVVFGWRIVTKPEIATKEGYLLKNTEKQRENQPFHSKMEYNVITN